MHLVSEIRPPVQRDRMLRLPEVEHLTGLKKSTIYRLMRERQFVQCVQITPRCTAWPESQCLQWVQDRIAGAVKASGGAQ
jgi:prophage regulatory protein